MTYSLLSMSTAPAWVSWAALALSAVSVVIAAMAHRAAGPRLRLRSRRLNAPDGTSSRGIPIQLTVVNSGRSAVSIEGFHLAYTALRKPEVYVKEIQSGPKLPFRLEAHASETWVVDALAPAKEFDRRSGLDDPIVGPAQFRFGVRAGNGKSAYGTAHYTAVRLIAEARPDSND